MSQPASLGKNEGHLYGDECDSLKCMKSIKKMIQNKNGQSLVVDHNGSLKFEHRNDRSDNTCFLFRLYSNNDLKPPKGLAITLQVLLNQQQLLLCCSERGNEKFVHAKPQEAPLPDIIDDSTCEFVFFLQKIRPHEKYKLESARWPNWYLSFRGVSEPAEPVLSEVADDVVNENIEILII